MIKIAAVILTLNEEPRIEEVLKQFKPHVDFILVVDGESIDKTVELAEKYTNHVTIRAFSGSFATEKNNAGKQVPTDCNWLLYFDADEVWDKGFLRNMRNKLKEVEETFGIGIFRFPRVNLPDGKNYPDYQCRLFPNSRDIQWKGDIHEVPWFIPENIRLDQVDKSDREKKIPVFNADDYPIIHLLRRTDIKRIWW